jgi:hypothetical protein
MQLLVTAKVNEISARAKLRRQLQVETQLRQSLAQKLPDQSELVCELIQ